MVKKLPNDISTQFLIIFNEEAARANRTATEKNKHSKQEIIKAGAVVRSLSEEERQEWITVMKPIWEKFEKDIAQDVIDAAVTA